MFNVTINRNKNQTENKIYQLNENIWWCESNYVNKFQFKYIFIYQSDSVSEFLLHLNGRREEHIRSEYT